MILFFVSFVLILMTSIFIVSIFETINFIKIFNYVLLTMFANIVLSIEILSIFSKISSTGILLLEVLFLIIALTLWCRKGRPIISIQPNGFFKKLKRAFIADKYLLILGVAFCFMCFVSLFLIATMPVINPDAEAYHVLRSLVWIDNGNLNHFPIGDVRNLPMPINSELLYCWLFLFLKKQMWLGIFPFTAFCLAIANLYGIMKRIGILFQKRLWTIFILASFPSVIVQISGTETDIIVAGLVLSSIYLFEEGVRENKNSPIYFSALAYALAIGTKTPALMLIVPVGIMYLIMSHFHLRQNFLKPFVKFIGFGVINFIFFASYNYVLNLLDYGNLLGSRCFLEVHKNTYGLPGAIAGFIKHIFLFFDFTGFTWDKTLGEIILNLKHGLLSILNLNGIPDGFYNKANQGLNRTLIEPLMGMGILGFLVYLPCWIKSMIMPIFSSKRKDLFLSLLGFVLLGTIFIMSCEITYMAFSIRFLTCFCVISAPILSYSYSRKPNFSKLIITFFALFGLLLVSTHLWSRPFVRIVDYIKQGASIHSIRETAKCSLFYKEIPKEPIIVNNMCKVETEIRKLDKRNKILYFPSNSENMMIIKLLQFEGYDIDFAQAEDLKGINVFDYNVLIMLDNKQISTNILHEDYASQYSPLAGVYCSYLDKNKNIYHYNKKYAPYFAKCDFTPRFINNYGLRLYNNLPIKLYENKNVLNLDYKFYENTHNPIIQ